MIKQAITTKFLGPTNHRGSRVVAEADAGRLDLPWNYNLGWEENHKAAMEAFAHKFEWSLDRILYADSKMNFLDRERL